MRKTVVLLVATLILTLVASVTADARRKATKSERQKIAEVFNAPPRCAKIYISTVNEKWGSYQFNSDTLDDKICQQVAADGVAILKRIKGQWKEVASGSAFECPIPGVPGKIRKDLKVRCVIP